MNTRHSCSRKSFSDNNVSLILAAFEGISRSKINICFLRQRHMPLFAMTPTVKLPVAGQDLGPVGLIPVLVEHETEVLGV